MTRQRLLPPHVRLALGLVTSGLVLGATAGGPWAFAPSALLWAAPLLVATRCLPLPLALPLVFAVAVTARTVVADGDVTRAMLASVVLLPVFVVDRLVEARAPRVSLVVWPLALTAVAMLTGTMPWGALVAPAPADGIMASLASTLDAWSVPLMTGLVGQAFGALGTVHNRPGDRFDPRVREAGVRWAAVVGIFVPVLVLAAVTGARWLSAG